ncbi:MAG: type I DNA topoisomerase [Victivallaceae bacterium]|nr:type I DNA topoisomerase [Victivallaceae bacterium]
MADNLVIVESPTKARTIGKMLGNDYTIMASVGHVRDLPTHSLGVDLKDNFTPLYVESERSKKVIKDLRAAAKKAKAVFLAPDPDREGEAIAWHLQELLKKQYKGEFKRVTFHEITKSAISKAFEHSTVVDMDLVDAQQARRVLDRMVGYMVSPLLWSQITRGTSAGRVQTVALRLIVEREREITAFKPEEYWNFSLKLEVDGQIFVAKLFKINADKFKIDNEKDALALLEAVCNGDGFKIDKIETKDRRRNAPPPFTTSTLQQAGNNLLHFSASNTMRLAQQLYEGVDTGAGTAGLITYMRTDSVNIAQEARNACRTFIDGNYGKEYVPVKPNFFKSKSGAQEAHEAIRPTDINNTPERMKAYLDDHQLKLYTLIWKRFAASQMSRALQRQTAVDVATLGADGKNYTFRANAMVTVFPGFMRLFGNSNTDEENHAKVLGQLREQQVCKLLDSLKEQKFTEPPARYSEASLIKKLEECGIGRPSTYATILRTIQTRNYVDKDKGKLSPTELGFQVTDFLIKVIPSLFEIDFTSRMETRLDEVESGKLVWTEMLAKFYESFAVWVKEAKCFGAPEHEKARAVIEQLETIKDWEAPAKVGRRTYDDLKFFNSVKDKYAETQVLTAKQWGVLLRLGAKYLKQLPEFVETAVKYDFVSDWEAALAKQNELLEKQANAPSEQEVAKYKDMLAYFDNVKWEEPVKAGKRTYDDKKFVGSFASQVDRGRVLSEKQLAVLGRFAVKYRDQISDFAALCGLIGIDPEKPEAQMKDGKPVEQDPEVTKLLADLEKITNWAEPVKKGKRVYDDKEFIESLRSQAKNGKILSPRQVAALKRTAKKYSDQI